MIDVKQNRDLIIVWCDHCASSIRLYASGLDEKLHDAIRGSGWRVDAGAFEGQYSHTCRGCLRKGR